MDSAYTNKSGTDASLFFRRVPRMLVSMEIYGRRPDHGDMDHERILRRALHLYVKQVKGTRDQASFARDLGVSQQTVSNMAGAGSVTIRHLAMLARLQGKAIGQVMLEVAALVVELERTQSAAPTTPTGFPSPTPPLPR